MKRIVFLRENVQKENYKWKEFEQIVIYSEQLKVTRYFTKRISNEKLCTPAKDYPIIKVYQRYLWVIQKHTENI